MQDLWCKLCHLPTSVLVGKLLGAGGTIAWPSKVFRCRLNSRAALEQLNSQFESYATKFGELSCTLFAQEKQ